MGTGSSNIASGLVSAYSQYSQGKTVASGYESSAKQVEWQRDDQISALKGQTESTVATQQASMAANGLDINSSTGVAVETGTRTNANLDEAAIRYNSNIQALQLKSQASQSKRSGKTSAASSLIGTAQQTYTGYQDWKKTSQSNGSYWWG